MSTKKKRTRKPEPYDDVNGPRKYLHRREDAPLLDLNMDDDQVDDFQTMFAEYPDLKPILASKKHPSGVDKMYGPKMERVIKLIAGEAEPKISEADISKIDFRKKTGELYERFIKALENHHKENERPKDVVARIDTSAADAARAKAEADRLAAEAAAKAAREAEDAKVPASIRGTAYDPRNLEKLTQQQRYDLAVKGLFALDELKSERSTPNLERIYDKMDETVRYTNKHLGTTYARPSEADPLSVQALTALGQRVATAGGIRGAAESVYTKAVTQAQLDAAAAVGLHALDRTPGITRDPEILRREIRQFERKEMGLSKVEADGVADAAMVAAIEQAVRARGGLAQVTGGQSLVAGVGAVPTTTPVVPTVIALNTKTDAPARP